MKWNITWNKIKDIRSEITVSEKELNEVKIKLDSFGIKNERKFIVIHIPSMGSAKVWSDMNFIDLINRILNDSELNSNLILTGTNSDMVQVKSITERIIPNTRVYAFFDLNLKQLAALLKLSALFIGNSTGPIHLAAAVGTFVVGLYSPVKEQSPVRWGPYTDKKKILIHISKKETLVHTKIVKKSHVYFLSNFNTSFSPSILFMKCK